MRTECQSDAVVGRAVEIRKASGKQSVFSWRLTDASEDNDVRDVGRLFHVHAAATGTAQTCTMYRSADHVPDVVQWRWSGNVVALMSSPVSTEMGDSS